MKEKEMKVKKYNFLTSSDNYNIGSNSDVSVLLEMSEFNEFTTVHDIILNYDFKYNVSMKCYKMITSYFIELIIMPFDSKQTSKLHDNEVYKYLDSFLNNEEAYLSSFIVQGNSTYLKLADSITSLKYFFGTFSNIEIDINGVFIIDNVSKSICTILDSNLYSTSFLDEYRTVLLIYKKRKEVYKGALFYNNDDVIMEHNKGYFMQDKIHYSAIPLNRIDNLLLTKY